MQYRTAIAVGAGLMVSVVSAAGLNMQQFSPAKAQAMAGEITRTLVQNVRGTGVPANEFAENFIFGEGGMPPAGVNSTLNLSWETSAWDTTYKTAYTRNPDGKIIEILEQEPGTTAGTWVNFERTTLEYNAGNMLQSSLSQRWSDTGSQWANYTKYEFTYTQDTITGMSGSIWLTPSNTWVPLLTGTFYYNATTASQLDSMITTISFGGARQSKQWMTYLGVGKIGQILDYERTDLTGAWINAGRSTRTYPSSTVEVEVTEEWDTTATAYVPVDSTVKENDADGNPLTETAFTRAASLWAGSSKVAYTYSNGIAAERLSQVWSAGQWENDTKIVYSTDVISGTSGHRAAPLKNRAIAVSVVPASNGKVHFLVSANPATVVSLYVYSMDGRLVASFKGRLVSGTGTLALDARGLNGMYICTVVTPQGTCNQLFSVTR